MPGKEPPILIWNSVTGTWELVDVHHGHRVIQWPEGFDPRTLPRPEYHDGDHVQFVRDETCAREGVIRRVFIQHAASRESNATSDVSTTSSLYETSDIIYIVTARGHDHRITASNILGRFISPERISRILPLQD